MALLIGAFAAYMLYPSGSAPPSTVVEQVEYEHITEAQKEKILSDAISTEKGRRALAEELVAGITPRQNYWAGHGFLFAIGLIVFPRITVLFVSAVSGGLLFWIWFLLFPRFTIPILAAAYYWHTNPVLVILSVFIFWPLEAGEKKVAASTV